MIPLRHLSSSVVSSVQAVAVASTAAGAAGTVAVPAAAPVAATVASSSGVTAMASLASAMLYMLSLRGLNNHESSTRGNVYGLMATGIAIGTVVLHPGFQGWALLLPTASVAGALGLAVAYTVEMEQMPQLVAGFHSFVGLSAVFVGYSHFLSVGANNEGTLKSIETL